MTTLRNPFGSEAFAVSGPPFFTVLRELAQSAAAWGLAKAREDAFGEQIRKPNGLWGLSPTAQPKKGKTDTGL